MLATTICDQQDVLNEAHRRYDEQVKSSPAQLVQLTRSHEARHAHKRRLRSIWRTNKRVQVSEAKAQLRLKEQTQRAEMLISELRQALTETADQDVANTRAALEMEVHLLTSSRRARAGMGDVYR